MHGDDYISTSSVSIRDNIYNLASPAQRRGKHHLHSLGLYVNWYVMHLFHGFYSFFFPPEEVDSRREVVEGNLISHNYFPRKIVM